MDSTLLAGLFGLTGSLIGGLTSYFGSKKAADNNIKAQQQIIKEQQKKESEEKDEQIRISARILYIDLLTALSEMLRLTQEVEKPHIGRAPENFPVNKDFSQHIAIISKELSYRELILINKLYGLIERLRSDILKHDYYKDNGNRCRLSANIIGVELFGEEYFNIAKNADYKQVDDITFMGNMLNQYKIVFDRIRKCL